MGRDLMRIQQEVLTHLQNAPAGRISVTVEVQGDSSGYDETTVRIVNENARTCGSSSSASSSRNDRTARQCHDGHEACRLSGLISVGKP
ncbi:MAG TPA: hypothetical protein VKP64_11645 [Mycobacteriales bacterium]|nr:hypothetical protein [Mycobacteriales bacterium]